jgi:RNA polymerase sigma factor (sigma-70 family)
LIADALMFRAVRPILVSDADDEALSLRNSILSEIEHDHGQALFGFVRRLGLADDQADDAVQDVLVRLARELAAGTAIGNPRAWTFRSIYRLAMDQHRLRRRLTGLVGRLGRAETPHRADVDDQIAVWAEVDRLPERRREVIYLRFRADLSFEEIGHVMGISASAARSHATQAMTTLRERLGARVDDR